jgi:ketosteroid isomerase-like protein|tara:strand:+ start:378 stop:635 length:258 start_codon:yes stop_codon:yes gene_type:complete
LPASGEKYVVATDAVTDVWMNYINAHNERDLDALMKMESDSISIDAQDGSVIQGKEIHRSALVNIHNSCIGRYVDHSFTLHILFS